MGVRKVKKEKKKERDEASRCHGLRSGNPELVSCSNRAASALCAANAIRANLKERFEGCERVFFNREKWGNWREKQYLLRATN